jgi:large subunit ribosomal protein L19
MALALRQLAASARLAFALGSTSHQLPPLACATAIMTDNCLRQLSQPLTTLWGFKTFASQSPVLPQEAVAITEAAAVEGGTPPPPWTPTRALAKRKTLPKRMGHLMQLLEQEKEFEAREARAHPEFSPGDLLELKLSVPENKRRTTVFKGICIAKRNRGYRTSFTLRNFVGGSGGIERSFPLYSPHLLEIKVLSTAKRRYRRAKLYYLRNVQPKEYRVA